MNVFNTLDPVNSTFVCVTSLEISDLKTDE
jgi:hypothetical protein